MKKRLILAFLLLGGIGSSSWAQSNVQPSAKTTEAIALGIVNPTTDAEMLALNTKASKLCWIEDVKGEVNPQNVFTLTLQNGQMVTLSEAELQNINPLLYNLPQQPLACENLIVQSTEGNFHLLIVRSEAMMQNELKRAQTKSK